MVFTLSPLSRAEWLIANGRLVLAAASLIAIWLDPSEPSKYAAATYSLLWGYLIYSLLAGFLVWALPAPLPVLQIATHAVDLLFFTVAMYLTEGPTSPFFAYFVFAIICATLRWNWRGTLWTTSIALTAFIGLGVYAAEVLQDPVFELNRFIIRSVYLGVVAGLLGYLGEYQQKHRSEISKLASMPWPVPVEIEVLVREVLEHSASILSAPRLLMVWEVAEEPRLNLALWSADDFHWDRDPPTPFGSLIAEALVDKSFLCQDCRIQSPFVVYKSSGRMLRWRGKLLASGFQKRFSIGSVISVIVRGGNLTGRLYFLDKPGITTDDLMISEIVGDRVAVYMDFCYLLQRLREAGATEERIRLARDLHDGLLQSLTGVALYLQTIDQLVRNDPDQARVLLLEVKEEIASEQRGLRLFVEDLKQRANGVLGPQPRLKARLEDLANRIERQWDLKVDLKLDQLKSSIPKSLESEIYFLTHEALFNVAWHAQASAARVKLGMREDKIFISVGDNGCGFPWKGRFGDAELSSMEAGPVMLSARVKSLGGSLVIHSTEAGAQLEITLPYSDPGA